jgi:hypothetical protein
VICGTFPVLLSLFWADAGEALRGASHTTANALNIIATDNATLANASTLLFPDFISFLLLFL